MATLDSALKGRSFTRVADFSRDELLAVLDLADDLKRLGDAREDHHLLPGRTLGMIFQKPSTRTRVSFEVGMYELGGSALYLSASDLQLGRGETIRDTAMVLSRYLDVMTIRERFGRLEGLRVVYLGDGNNVCASLMVACAALGLEFVAATPRSYAPDERIVAVARDRGGRVDLTDDPRAAADGADVLYTDVWTSMGQDAEREQRLRDLTGYAIDSDLVALADPHAI